MSTVQDTAASTVMDTVPVTSVTAPNQARITVSRLATVPMVLLHLAVPVRLDDHDDLAATDLLSASWPELPEARDLERRGGAVTVSRRRQYLILSLSAPAEELERVLAVLAAVLAGAEPAPTATDAARAACRRQAGLIHAHPGVRSQSLLWGQVYGAVPAILDAAPDPAAYDAVPGLARVSEAHLRPAGSHLVVVGDIDADAVTARLLSVVAAWPARQPVVLPRPTPRAGAGVLVDERTDLPASHLRLAAESLPIGDPGAFTTASLASLVLGGNFSSRLNTALRETAGIAYRTSSHLNDHHDRVVLVVEADVSLGSEGLALEQVSAILEDLAERGPTDEELRAAVGYTLGTHELGLGTQHGRASCLLSYLTTGQGLAALGALPRVLGEVRRTEVSEVCRLFHPIQFAGVLSGPVGDESRQGEFRYEQ